MTFTGRNKTIAMLFLLLLAGCGGGGADATLRATTVSEGQELMDLKKALDTGAITQSEYDTQRKKVLNENR